MYRFASSPSRDMDINSLRIALFNYICAKQSGDMFIVRIEDSDKAKNIEGKDQEILDILAIFGITYDSLYYQSENFKYHLQFASFLMDKKKAFACFCTENELKNEKYSGKCLHVSDDELLNNNLPFTIRIKSDIDSFVIMKQDKYPTYNFACATDDMLQGIKQIIRDKDHILNTPKQELIRRSLGYEDKINYTHIPAIQNIDDKSSVKWLLDQGFMPESIINYLVLLGNEVPTEIFSIAEAMEWFEIDKISEEPVKFDINKLKFINREQIKLIENVELSKRIGYSCASIGKLAKLYTQEENTTAEIKKKIDTIFAPKISEEYKESLDKLKITVKDAPYFEEFEEFKKYLSEKSELKGENFSKALRILLTGEQSGPDLEEVYPLIKNYLQEITK
ncbi:MAG TPA: glutamate--tRNA ligase [Sulfurospirillum arcachonense]|nr:glutamate--tRNA ligase [Sulfurospirillum arcachonense]